MCKCLPQLGMMNTHGGQIIGSRRLAKAGSNFVTKFPASKVPQASSIFLTETSEKVCRQAVLDAGLYDASFRRSEDFDLWLRMTHRGASMGYLSQDDPRPT